MHLFVNSLAASAGGGLTYIRNVLPRMAATTGLRITVALTPAVKQQFVELKDVEFLELQVPVARRFWYEQSVLPEMIRRSGADILLSTGNFALRKSPVPQILLSRNSIYTSADYYRDLRARHQYRAWLDTRVRGLIAKRSIRWASVTVAPSEAFARELRRWSGAEVMSIHHGFDRDAFFRDSSPLTPEIEGKLCSVDDSLTILFVSHYNYYRNFETLIRALPFLRERFTGRSIKLLLTCQLSNGQNPGAYNPETAAKLIHDLGVSDMVIELGSVPYQQLHQVYARANVYVTPAYTETFAHPLVEAMASGVPVVASDLLVHREICEGAARYFPTFSAETLAEEAAKVLSSSQVSKDAAEAGRRRSQDFSWGEHVKQILALSRRLTGA